MTDEPRRASWDSISSELFQELVNRLREEGYTERGGKEPGTYHTAMDGGAGWSSWVHWLDVTEREDRPVIDSLRRVEKEHRAARARARGE